MATPPPAVPIHLTSSANPHRLPQFLPSPATPAAAKRETSSADTRETLPPAAAAHTPEPSAPLSYTITIPSCAAWFSWDDIHDTERRILPEFFDGKSPSRNPGAYKYYRDSIIRRFRGNPSRKLTFTEVRRGLVGDVGSVRRVFDFLEGWGLINYVPSAKPFVKERREAEENPERKEQPKKLCSACQSVCNLVCFITDREDITLCARCFVRGNYRPGLSSSDFKRIDISGETKSEWTDKETLHLLEAVLQYGEDWKKVAEHVGSRSEKECVARFIRLPFGEQFLGLEEEKEVRNRNQKNDLLIAEPEGKTGEEPCLPKQRRLSPLADASNPIMAQVAFLSSMVGLDVAEAASKAAIVALNEVGLSSVSDVNGLGNETNKRDDLKVLEVAAEIESKLEKEHQAVEQSICDIVEVQMKEIQEKIAHFEEVELLLEKERLQSRYMKDLLFADQLSILQQKAQLKSLGGDAEKTRTNTNTNAP